MLRAFQHIVLCIALVCAFCRQSVAALNNAEEFYLDNGLQVVVIPNHKAPIIKQILLYKAGRIDEPQGKGGIAHFLEHLMFRGTQKFADGRFNELIENNGGQSNAATGHDYTYYYQFISLDRLELAMYLEADRMTGLSFSEKAFAKEKNVVSQERMERLNMSPMSVFWENFERLFWQDSPYGEPVSGTSAQIEQITQQDIWTFYQKFYAPNNAILILSGDIDTKTAQDLAQKYYGKIKSHTNSAMQNIQNIKSNKNHLGKYTLQTEREDINITRVVQRCLLPKYKEDDKNLYSMILLSEYLGGSVNSPLYQKLKLQTHWVTSVGTDFDYLNRENGTFSFYAYPTETKNIYKIQSVFTSAIKTGIKNLTSKELEKVKNRLLSGMIYSNDNPAETAEIAVHWLGAGYSLQGLKDFERHIQSITVEDIRKSAEYLTQCDFMTGIAMPHKGGQS